MTLPDNVAAMIDGLEERGQPIPESYHQPDVSDEARPFLSAFWILHGDRQSGFGSGPIPFTAIDRYAARMGIAGDEFWVFETMIRACDSEWLKHANAKNGSGKEKSNTVSSQPLTAERFDALFG